MKRDEVRAIPMTTHERPTRAVIEQFLRIVDDPENQPVYVHCVGGRHRTGVMTAVYRMTTDSPTIVTLVVVEVQ